MTASVSIPSRRYASGEQEVRLKLYNTGLTALREMRVEVALDGKPQIARRAHHHPPIPAQGVP